MKNYEFDYEMYPDGISEVVNDLEPSVWDRGYYCETEEGVWYELYVNETVKSDYPTIAEDFNNIELWNKLKYLDEVNKIIVDWSVAKFLNIEYNIIHSLF